MKLYKIKKSKIDNKGRGLYATKDIKKGTKIINYTGKIITNKQVDNSDKFDNSKPIFLFTLNKRYTLDGDFQSNTAGLIPRTTFHSIPGVENSTSTLQSFSFVVLINCGLLILRKDLPNREKVKASRTVLFPAPLDPIIKFVACSVKLISVN